MSFIKLSHHDTTTLIAMIEEIEPLDRTAQENKTLDKLRLILVAQKQKQVAGTASVSPGPRQTTVTDCSGDQEPQV
jgi:5-formyltetrahydrofolate cyclo-ligase